jgi:hypothetical protein
VIHAPVGNGPMHPAEVPQMKVPVAVCILRPKWSPSAPQMTAPTMAPTPAPYRISAPWP